MMKFATLVAVGVLLASPIANSVASEYTGDQIVFADHSMRVSKLIGTQVYNDQGESIGSVIEVLVKGESMEPMAVLSVGDYVGGGSKMVAVSLSHFNLIGLKL